MALVTIEDGASLRTMLNFIILHSPLLYLVQSIWRDEAFSILLSQRSPAWFLTRTFEPPLYYILLHYWMKIFGSGEIAARSLSLAGFILSVVVVIFWSEKLFKKSWLSWYLPVFFSLNPTILYYAFEIRAYAWYVLFTVISLYAYLEKKWKLNGAAIILGLYTHSYMVIVPFTQAVHYLIIHRKTIPWHKPLRLLKDQFIRSLLAVFLLFTPWLYLFSRQLGSLKNAWYFPVDFHLIRSVLGNLFVGYEGTPGYFWDYSTLLSVALLGLFVFALTNRRYISRNSLFFLLIIVPLTIIIGISFKKPLYVNRYVIPVTVAEVFLAVFALEAIKKPAIRILLAAGLLFFTVGFNIWYPSRHAKLDIRTTITQINDLKSKNDVILAESPLIFFESIYYSKDRSRVFLYNPDRYPFPWYVGGTIVSSNQIVSSLPVYPVRAYFIKEDGTYEIRYKIDIGSHLNADSK